MSIYAILINNLFKYVLSFNIAVLIGVKCDVSYFCDETDEALHSP